MHEEELFVQTSQRTGEVYRGLLKVATSARFSSLLVMVAYATRIGCAFIDVAFGKHVPGWRRIEKKWLVSIDYGITEPDAIKYLADLPNSEVRIPNAEGVLRANLRPSIRFHHKIYAFESLDHESIGIFSGSPNLTFSGLHLNGEQASAFILTPPYRGSGSKVYDSVHQKTQLLREIYEAVEPLDGGVLSRYRAIWRPTGLSGDANRVVKIIAEPRPELPLTKAAAIATAPVFWIEVKRVVFNHVVGMRGNQLDLQRGSRTFFGFGVGEVRRNTTFGAVGIRYGGSLVNCTVRFGNNQMDKLNLPPTNNPGPGTYVNKTLLFRRNADETFEMTLGSKADIAEWKGRSRQQGTLYRMQGGREYGVFR